MYSKTLILPLFLGKSFDPDELVLAVNQGFNFWLDKTICKRVCDNFIRISNCTSREIITALRVMFLRGLK